MNWRAEVPKTRQSAVGRSWDLQKAVDRDERGERRKNRGHRIKRDACRNQGKIILADPRDDILGDLPKGGRAGLGAAFSNSRSSSGDPIERPFEVRFSVIAIRRSSAGGE
jgi:hypothetical protein